MHRFAFLLLCVATVVAGETKCKCTLSTYTNDQCQGDPTVVKMQGEAGMCAGKTSKYKFGESCQNLQMYPADDCSGVAVLSIGYNDGGKAMGQTGMRFMCSMGGSAHVGFFGMNGSVRSCVSFLAALVSLLVIAIFMH
eukprot:NODE_665_length_683_cov_247.028777_g656_i0.p1 GENE.NODE_665_length_683_cov_247.028777_g656_i0~~NODE_665_length_683_cov_247.028777_g656_i0.p1  ORF type:complete len:138 (+),score=13.38 NODE_665_length_683_cov_247.028777_g656_i0:51-464(+)